MTNFRIEYSHPWLLLLLIPAVVLTFLPYFRSPKKYRRTRNRILSIVFHLTALVLAINLLAGINFAYEVPNKENQVIILVDASDSGTERKEAKDEFVASVVNVCDNQYALGIVKFGFDQKYVAEISEDAYEAYEKYLVSEDPDTSATDLASAIKYASSLFTNPKTAKIVVVSDGMETDNAATSVIKAIAAEGIKVDTVHFPNEEKDEIQIVDVKLPEGDIILGETFIAEITVKHNLGAGEHSIKITASDNGASLGETEASLTKEEETLQIALSVDKRGVHEFAFNIESDKDTVLKNNSYHSFVNLQTFENILIIERREGDGKALAELLNQDYKATTLSLDADYGSIPASVEQMADYEQIILINVAYSDMPAGFEENLNRYVYELGGGLLTVGGENDIVGGKPVPHAYNRNDIANSTYFKQMLPINAIDFTPPIAVVLVLDMSASMSSGRIEAARAGAEACLSVLSDRDFCGVVSFQTRSEEKIELLPVSQKEELIEVIRGSDHDNDSTHGGTIFSDAIMRAGNTLRPVDYVERKHIILVTDGNPGDTPEQYLPYVRENLEDGITMSIVVVEDADYSIEKNMGEAAKEGGGTFYEIPMNKLETIPNVMQGDLVLNAVAEIEYGKDFLLTIKDLSPITAGIDQNAIPPLSGYYGTVAKKDAVVPLMAEYAPMYAEWQYGKGTVGSFMCDLGKQWSAAFMEDVVGQAIIRNIVNSVFPTEDVVIDSLKYLLKTDNYTSQLSVFGALENEKVEVEVLPVSDSLASSLEEGVSVKVVEENKRYSFILKDAGLYRVKIKRLSEAGELLSELSFYKSFSYSEEYNAFTEKAPIGKELLAILAKDGNGVEVEDPATVFESFSKTLAREFDPRILFLIISIVCVLLDIAVRKFKFKWPHELIREHKQKKAEKASKSE